MASRPSSQLLRHHQPLRWIAPQPTAVCIFQSQPRPRSSHPHAGIASSFSSKNHEQRRSLSTDNTDASKNEDVFSPHPRTPHTYQTKEKNSNPDYKSLGFEKSKRYEKSVKTLQRGLIRENLPHDLGVTMGTLIMPPNHKLPGFIGHPLKRSNMEIQRLWKRFKDFVSVLSYKFQGPAPRPKIRFRRTVPLATALHRQMYTALAEGDLRTLRSMICEGLTDTLEAQVGARPRGVSYAWTLHRYVTPPRVVSHRAALLPLDDGSSTKPAIRQAVVRIHSVQSLRRIGGSATSLRPSAAAAAGEAYLARAPPGGRVPGLGDVVGKATEPEEVEEREVLEYVVVQRRVYKGKEEEWKIWGTTEETPLEKFEQTLHPDMTQGAAAQKVAEGAIA